MSASPARGVAVVGCGAIALERHIPAWLERPSGFYLAAVVDPADGRRTAARIAGGLVEDQAGEDLSWLLDRTDIGVVDVCVPPHLRPAIVQRAAEAGKHVLTEKPLATTPAAAAAMVTACDENGVRLGVVHNYLHFPEIVASRRVIDEGAIGTPEVAILNYLGVREDPGARTTWRYDPASSGGGVLMDFIHVVYLAEALLGQEIESVSAYVTARDRQGVEDIAVCRFETRDRVALANVGWGFGPGGIDVSGSSGRLTVRYQGGGTSPFAPLEKVEVDDGTRVTTVTTPPDTGFLAPAVRAFADALARGVNPVADGRQALHALEVTVAAYASAAMGRSVSVPLDVSSPIHRLGVGGLSSSPFTAKSALVRKHLFSLAQELDWDSVRTDEGESASETSPAAQAPVA